MNHDKSQNDFRTYLQITSKKIKNELIKFSKDWNNHIKPDFSELEELNQHFTNSFLGGKMLRGTLVTLGYNLVNEKQTKAIMKPAIAYEIIHTSLIIHDDIIDQSPMRRGKPSIHTRNKNVHHGISQAICLGDLGITFANKLIAESDFPIENRHKALSYFLQMIIDTILGQMLDLESSYSQNRSEEQVISIHRMKTAQYTFVGTLSLGALLGGASDELLNDIKLFGENLGIAYQIQDDILGVFGNETEIGKSTTSDIEENKSTLLLTYGLQHATKEQKKYLETYYGKKGITKVQQEIVKKIFRDTDSLTYSQKKAAAFITKAITIIPHLSNDNNKKELLTQFAESLIGRKK
ncbi:MAG TPA: polyprenyl synthetase family protein [Candidatus Sulfotelmatobacter sp.]|nr:polyprenyl synthetase family protein [Candidatus Sulfotelmatobacter sp.]